MALVDFPKGCDIWICLEVSMAELDLFKEFARDEFLAN